MVVANKEELLRNPLKYELRLSDVAPNEYVSNGFWRNAHRYVQRGSGLFEFEFELYLPHLLQSTSPRFVLLDVVLAAHSSA